MKKNWIYILILFLLTVNIALIVTIMVRNNRTGDRFVRKAELKHEFFHRGESKNFEMHITKNLGMTESQVEKVKTISNDFHKQKQELMENMNVFKEKYFENLASEQSNPELLSALADSLGELHSKLIKLDYQHYKNIKSICTAEQAHMMDSLGRLHMNNIQGGHCENHREKHKKSEENCHLSN